eukprot:CAMPEP_0184643202 /NCGR_PEP_ID=MMETSP0308-20130426/3_1 /TAXON_ID=38269 /ORGANISM="Gloeochaete witrockiana, Strain SAG 46.84" /LENGTH=593 /DNA_ID=CAMNT_0027070959 /DNA_START=280 /DNA_END=2061 /DNA_ORIENTATION=-
MKSVTLYHPKDEMVVYFLHESHLGMFFEASSRLKVEHLDAEAILSGSPLAKWFANRTEWEIEGLGAWDLHLSEALRLAILYSQGGVYLDADILLTRPLPESVRNSLAPEKRSSHSVEASVLFFEKGHHLLLEAMRVFSRDYSPLRRVGNAPLALRKACSSSRNCRVLSGRAIYTFSEDEIPGATGYDEKDFSIEHSSRILTRIKKASFAVHLRPHKDDQFLVDPKEEPQCVRPGSTAAQLLQAHTKSDSNFGNLPCRPCWEDCRGGPAWCEDSRAAQRLIYESQNPSNCSKAKFIVFRTPSNGNGIGSCVSVKALALAFAVQQGRVLIFEEKNWIWSNCSDADGMSCYFMPTTNCSLEGRNFTVVYLKRLLWLNRTMENYPAVKILHPAEEPWGHSTPLPRFAQRHGLVWWRAQAIKYLTRPNAYTINLTETVRKELQLPQKRISLHVRHGDKGKEMPLVPFSTYIDLTLELSKRTGIKDVFLATETEAFIKHAAKVKGLRFHTQPRICAKNLNETTPADRLECARILLPNLFLAAECQYHVGTIMSNWSRLVMALQRTKVGGGTAFIDAHGLNETYVWCQKKTQIKKGRFCL